MKHVLCWFTFVQPLHDMHAACFVEGSPEIGKTRPSDMRLRHAYRDIHKYNTYIHAAQDNSEGSPSRKRKDQ
eukprot:scaffold36826_cov190-Skeletonema_marinoi.AAC.1